MEKLPGVEKVVIRFETRHCFVRYDRRKQNVRSLIRAIEKRGLEAEVDTKASWPPP